VELGGGGAVRVRPGKFLPLAFDVAAVSGVTVRELFSPSRQIFVMEARHALRYALMLGGWPSKAISRVMGEHHTTTLNGLGRAMTDPYIFDLAHEALAMFQAKERQTRFATGEVAKTNN